MDEWDERGITPQETTLEDCMRMYSRPVYRLGRALADRDCAISTITRLHQLLIDTVGKGQGLALDELQRNLLDLMLDARLFFRTLSRLEQLRMLESVDPTARPDLECQRALEAFACRLGTLLLHGYHERGRNAEVIGANLLQQAVNLAPHLIPVDQRATIAPGALPPIDSRKLPAVTAHLMACPKCGGMLQYVGVRKAGLGVLCHTSRCTKCAEPHFETLSEAGTAARMTIAGNPGDSGHTPPFTPAQPRRNTDEH